MYIFIRACIQVCMHKRKYVHMLICIYACVCIYYDSSCIQWKHFKFRVPPHITEMFQLYLALNKRISARLRPTALHCALYTSPLVMLLHACIVPSGNLTNFLLFSISRKKHPKIGYHGNTKIGFKIDYFCQTTITISNNLSAFVSTAHSRKQCQPTPEGEGDYWPNTHIC